MQRDIVVTILQVKILPDTMAKVGIQVLPNSTSTLVPIKVNVRMCGCVRAIVRARTCTSCKARVLWQASMHEYVRDLSYGIAKSPTLLVRRKTLHSSKFVASQNFYVILMVICVKLTRKKWNRNTRVFCVFCISHFVPEVDNSPQNGHVFQMFLPNGPQNWAISNSRALLLDIA